MTVSEWIDHIVARVEAESFFVEKSGYTIATLRDVLTEELRVRPAVAPADAPAPPRRS